MNTRQCTHCKKHLPLSSYYKRTDTKGLKAKCKQCECLYSRARNYKITIAEAEALIITNKCDCCGKLLDDKRHTYIDHCHNTSEIRGVLCMSCNSGIGFLGDNLEGVLRAVNYLTKNKNQ